MYEAIIIIILICILFASVLDQLTITIFLTLLLLFIIIRTVINIKKKKPTINKNFDSFYIKKQFMTNNELNFYYKLIDLEKDYKIVPQINLASIIKKQNGSHFQNELFRNIDFAIFNKDYSKILLLIELNDQSHENSSRKERDKKVRAICYQAKIKLITFYTKYPNEKDYVTNRILNEINK